ncbi:MAG: mechanosensitive ion channel family protein [Candidatus Aminicenantes bacterium]|nr:mechanosensitive ion channel family protein [Candidatus Aminicenantes bacterium]
MTMSSKIKGKGWRIFISRLGWPAAFIILIIIAKKVWPFGDAVRSYLEAALVFFAVFFVIRLLDAALLVKYTQRRKPYPLPDVLRGLILAALYLVLLFVILKTKLQFDIKPFLTGSAILTAILGLAFQGVLSNILSGMSLHFTHSFGRGDWVGIGPHEGVVVDTNWRETRLLDRNSNIVVIPNNTVAAERIINYTRPDRKTALILTLKVSASAPASEVLAAVLAGAGECPYVLAEPEPKAYITSYDETGVSYTLKFWVEDFAQKFTIIGDVGRLVWYKLGRRGIEVAVSWPDRFQEVREAIEASHPEARVVGRAGAEFERTKAVLLGSSFLRRQTGDKAAELIVGEDEIAVLAEHVRRSVYAKDEVLCRQGDRGASCFVVAKGRIRGEIVYEESGKKYVSEFAVGPGGIFGEMSLFTGMPRTATGIVIEESELIEIRAEDFAVLIGRNPALAEVIAEIVSRRNEENREFLKKIKELSEKDIQDGTNKKTILAYLKRFVHGLIK